MQNFTDIDDKLIKKANEEGTTVAEVAARYIKEYWTDAKGLGVREADYHPKATENIDTIIDVVKRLEERGYAYAKDGDVYFRSRKFGEYGKLSHQPLDALDAGNRIDVSSNKDCLLYTSRGVASLYGGEPAQERNGQGLSLVGQRRGAQPQPRTRHGGGAHPRRRPPAARPAPAGRDLL